MARRRDSGMLSFDVSSEQDERFDSGPDDGGDGAPQPTLRDRWRTVHDRWLAVEPRRRRRVSLAAGSVVLAVAAGFVASGAVATHNHREQLRAAPGGVVSLDGELTEVWQAQIDAVAAVLPEGGLVVVDGDAVVAIDVADGSQRWSLELGADLQCGPRPMLSSAVEWAEPVDLVTCVHGDDAERTATVIAADGAVVGQRVLDPERYGGDDLFVAPAAEGSLAIAEYDDTLPEQLEIEVGPGGSYSFPQDLELTAGGSIWVEDALTGDVRHEARTRESGDATMIAHMCYQFTTDPISNKIHDTAELRRTAPIATPRVVTNLGCGPRAAMSIDGTDLLGAEDSDHYWARSWTDEMMHRPVLGGGFVVPWPGGSALVSDDGTPVVESRQYLAAPRATDGSAEELRLGASGETLVATDLDGEELWRARTGSQNFVVHSGDVVTAVTWEGSVALDPADGSELWRSEPTEPTNRWIPLSAVTDGTRVAVGGVSATEHDDGLRWQLATTDLTTGEEIAPELEGEGMVWPVAVDGHLLLIELDPETWDDALSVRGMAAQ